MTLEKWAEAAAKKFLQEQEVETGVEKTQHPVTTLELRIDELVEVVNQLSMRIARLENEQR